MNKLPYFAMNKLPYFALKKFLVYLDATSYDYFLFDGKLFATYCTLKLIPKPVYITVLPYAICSFDIIVLITAYNACVCT